MLVMLALVRAIDGASAPIVTNVEIKVDDANLWAGATAGTKSLLAQRTKKIDVMKGLYYSAEDKELLADHNAMIENSEYLAEYFASWYTQGLYIVIMDPDRADVYLYLLSIVKDRLAVIAASLNGLAKKKTSNRDFQNIRQEMIIQVEATAKAVDKLIKTIKTYVR